MSKDSSIPDSWWADALKTTIYIINRVSSKAVDKIPYELWAGKKSSIRHSHIWDCLAKVRPYKLNEMSKRYKFYDLSSRSFFEMSNTKFSEDNKST